MIDEFCVFPPFCVVQSCQTSRAHPRFACCVIACFVPPQGPARAIRDSSSWWQVPVGHAAGACAGAIRCECPEAALSRAVDSLIDKTSLADVPGAKPVSLGLSTESFDASVAVLIRRPGFRKPSTRDSDPRHVEGTDGREEVVLCIVLIGAHPDLQLTTCPQMYRRGDTWRCQCFCRGSGLNECWSYAPPSWSSLCGQLEHEGVSLDMRRNYCLSSSLGHLPALRSGTRRSIFQQQIGCACYRPATDSCFHSQGSRAELKLSVWIVSVTVSC